MSKPGLPHGHLPQRPVVPSKNGRSGDEASSKDGQAKKKKRRQSAPAKAGAGIKRDVMGAARLGAGGMREIEEEVIVVVD